MKIGKHRKKKDIQFLQRVDHIYSAPLIKYIYLVIEKFNIQATNDEINNLIHLLEVIYPKELSETVDWSFVQILTIQLIHYVERETGINFSTTALKFHDGLYRHMGALINRLKNGIQFNNPLTDNIKLKSPIIYSAIKKFFIENESMFHHQIIDDELAYLTIYFSTIDSELRQKGEYFYKVAVICNHGKATGNLLAENLRELFNVDVIAVLSSRELYLLNRLDVDLVFSTLPIKYQNKPLLVIEPIIRETSKQLIKDFLNQHSDLRRFSTTDDFRVNKLFHKILNLFDKRNIKVDDSLYGEIKTIFSQNNFFVNDEEVKPLIKDVLTEEKILVNVLAKDWEDAIRIVGEPLVKGGEITPDYIDAMINSVKEYGPYIVVDKGIALAHARPEDGVKEVGLSIATLTPPINFGHEENDPVNTIFCLSAVDSFSHLNIMKELVNLIQAPEKLSELLEAKNQKEAINIILN